MLPQSCERALLERFLKAEAMALRSVRAALTQDVPPHVRTFLRRHEQDEQEHLRSFETILGTTSWEKAQPPKMPGEWWALAVHLYGYEALGLEFAKLLVHLRPDLSEILSDEQLHVRFYERELKKILATGGGAQAGARVSAAAWWRKLPRTVDRYLGEVALEPYRQDLYRVILGAIECRFNALGLLS
jgi:hypothetical protein